MKLYKISKRMEIAGSHQLKLPYESKCSNLHGHNWIVTVYCKSSKLTEYGMIVDFAKVKKEIHGFLDHGYLNELLPDINPTAENIAEWICMKVTDLCETGFCYRVDVQESEGNVATFECEVD
ncbi:MAG: 6-carboxytetrahydropterin synthase [Bacteroidaceae bacterium]|nr:6-carboxytetrahydropterin synthase [Bacteroidaceae bacterium]